MGDAVQEGGLLSRLPFRGTPSTSRCQHRDIPPWRFFGANPTLWGIVATGDVRTTDYKSHQCQGGRVVTHDA
jgi:hypothetical protein